MSEWGGIWRWQWVRALHPLPGISRPTLTLAGFTGPPSLVADVSDPSGASVYPPLPRACGVWLMIFPSCLFFFFFKGNLIPLFYIKKKSRLSASAGIEPATSVCALTRNEAPATEPPPDLRFQRPNHRNALSPPERRGEGEQGSSGPAAPPSGQAAWTRREWTLDTPRASVQEAAQVSPATRSERGHGGGGWPGRCGVPSGIADPDTRCQVRPDMARVPWGSGSPSLANTWSRPGRSPGGPPPLGADGSLRFLGRSTCGASLPTVGPAVGTRGLSLRPGSAMLGAGRPRTLLSAASR